MDDAKDDPRIALGRQAQELSNRLRGLADAGAISQGRELVDKLRRHRMFPEMTNLAEALVRNVPKDTKTRRLYAQGLIEAGKPSVAADVLKRLGAGLRMEDPEWAEARGLLGRASKQIFIEAQDKASPLARTALKEAIAAYRVPFEAAPAANTWHGVNLAALLTRARDLKLRLAPDLEPAEVGRRVLDELARVPESNRDAWHHAAFAEAALTQRDWPSVERHLGAYVQDAGVSAFNLGSTLRQFTEIWDLESDPEHGQGLIAALRAKLMTLPGGRVDIDLSQLQRLRTGAAPNQGQLQAILGVDGPQTYRWWQTGLERGRSVAAVRRKLGDRIGTGFLVSAEELGLEPKGERLLLTNHHVINSTGAYPGVPPEEVEVVFEADRPSQVYGIAQLLCQSPPDKLDMALARLTPPIEDLPPLPLAKALPALEEGGRVYVIGHPGGRDLSFSFQDNELIDHEGPPDGTPLSPDVRRVHYRAPTEGGSSGSPVFNSRLWQVIALHHLGGKSDVRRLNGKTGAYAANEGIWIQSVRDGVASGQWRVEGPGSG